MFSLKYLIGFGGAAAIAGGATATAISLISGKTQINEKITKELQEPKKDKNTNSPLPSIDSGFYVSSSSPTALLNSKLVSINL